jgi:hypothetical protein
VGLVKESLDTFKTNLEDRMRMIAVSQLAASAITRHLNTDLKMNVRWNHTPSMGGRRSLCLDGT